MQSVARELANLVGETKGTIEDWVLEGHKLAQSVAYGQLGAENPVANNVHVRVPGGPGD